LQQKHAGLSKSVTNTVHRKTTRHVTQNSVTYITSSHIVVVYTAFVVLAGNWSLDQVCWWIWQIHCESKNWTNTLWVKKNWTIFIWA